MTVVALVGQTTSSMMIMWTVMTSSMFHVQTQPTYSYVVVVVDVVVTVVALLG